MTSKQILRTLQRTVFLFCGALLMMSFAMTGPVTPITIQLPAGTRVTLETTRIISSETLQIGQMVDFKVTSDVKVNGNVVIPAGSLATGQVMRTDKPKALGKQGKIEIEIKSVKAVDGQDIPLSGSPLFREGEDKQTLAIVLGVLVCLLCLLIKGKNAVIPSGTSVTSNVAANSEIELK